MGYTIYATSQINDVLDLSMSKEDIELSLALDVDSEIIEEYQTEGDQSFLISWDNLTIFS